MHPAIRYIRNILRLLKQHTKRPIPWTPEREQKDALLLQKLTTDLLLKITDVLEPVYHIVLSKTCKSLRRVLFDLMAKAYRDPNNRIAYHQLLEKDISDTWYFCHRCMDFHLRCRLRLRAPGKLIEPCPAVAFDFQESSALPFHFTHAKLIMDRHLWGEGRGLEIFSLFFGEDRIFRKDKSQLPTDAPWETRWLPNIKRNNLVFRVEHKLRYRVSRDSEIDDRPRLPFDPFDHKLCPHVSASWYWYMLSWTSRDASGDEDVEAIYEEPRPRFLSPGDAFIALDRRRMCCTQCVTDFETTVKYEGVPGPSDGGVPKPEDGEVWCTVSITAHRLFGRCRTPQDEAWRQQTEASCHDSDRWQYMPGAVKTLYESPRQKVVLQIAH
ncbi:hypothetical protein F5Y15DRAFT_300175 [Xylariaceae sp. FL0016]|nr:hypothetical protein F5Y15DRAFT_300175 [Xylariaceae sp. FL0016]